MHDGEDTVLLTVKQAAALLGVCGATVYAMVERGDLDHVRVSNSIRVVVARPAIPRGSEGR